MLWVRNESTEKLFSAQGFTGQSRRTKSVLCSLCGWALHSASS